MGKLSQGVGSLNDADRLRGYISDCEKMLAALNGITAQTLMQTADAAHSLISQLEDDEADIRGEAARLTAVDERILRYARNIVKLTGGRNSFVQFREQVAQKPLQRFWLLDRELDLARTKFLRQIGVFALVIAIVICIGYLGRSVLFPPDPAGDAVALATRKLTEQKPLDALQAIDDGLTIVPTNTELLVWRGYLLEQNGDTKAADQSYALALNTAESDKGYYLTRAVTFVRLGEYYRVITDTTILIERYPDNAESYYMRASGYEGIHAISNAIADLEKCGELAEAAGNETLFAQSRVRLATLMQSMR